jgi:arsenate reductase
MENRVYNVLFLCTGNSARSILAEAILRHWGKGRFQAYSAGSQPTGQVNPLALEMLQNMKMPVDGLRSKSWLEFSQPGAPAMDFVFTVCDNAANEVCPIWPGQPMSAHWGIADPAAAHGDMEKRRRAFRRAYLEMESRIKIFVNLRHEALDRLSLQDKLVEIGKLPAETPEA